MSLAFQKLAGFARKSVASAAAEHEALFYPGLLRARALLDSLGEHDMRACDRIAFSLLLALLHSAPESVAQLARLRRLRRPSRFDVATRPGREAQSSLAPPLIGLSQALRGHKAYGMSLMVRRSSI